jgi:GNAT superfamily N-acetyltransferase
MIRDCEPIDHLLIDQVGVAPPWWRRGIARPLVDDAIDLARSPARLRFAR